MAGYFGGHVWLPEGSIVPFVCLCNKKQLDYDDCVNYTIPMGKLGLWHIYIFFPISFIFETVQSFWVTIGCSPLQHWIFKRQYIICLFTSEQLGCNHAYPWSQFFCVSHAKMWIDWILTVNQVIWKRVIRVYNTKFITHEDITNRQRFLMYGNYSIQRD